MKSYKIYFAICASIMLTAMCVNAQDSGRLVGWWKMDEAVGATTLVDSSGHGRNATLGSGVSIVDGKFGKAALFNGNSNAWARFISNTTLTNFTLASWVKVTSFANSYPKMFQLGICYYQFNTANPGRFSLGIGSSPRADWISNGTDPFIAETNKWLHTAVVIKREYINATEWLTQPIFYINGVRCGTLQTAKTYSPDAAGSSYYGYLGNTGANGPRAFDGAMDDVRIYDQCLSDREILDVYQYCPVAVDAGAGQTSHRASSQLQGELTSTNPYSASRPATSVWSVVSSPAGDSPIFENASLPVTSVTLPEAGTYVFRLTAVSELGTSSNDVTIVQVAGEAAGNIAPVVTTPWSTTNTVLSQGAALTANVSDDGIPSAVPRVCWSKVSGPGGVFFDNAFANTTAYFSTNGTYVLELEADDGAAIGSAQVTVNVSLSSGDLSDGLIHWWRMDEDPALTTSQDASGDNTLTLRNKTLLQPGKSGNGLRFPLASSYAQATTFTNANTFTFSLWLYYDAAYTDNIGKRIFDYGTTSFFLYFDPDHLLLKTKDLAESGYHSWRQQNYSLENDKSQWVHLAVLYDRRPNPSSGQTQGFYINGVSTGSSALGGEFDGSQAFAGGDLKIGGNGSVRNFDGVFDELRVYDRLLTEEEIKLLAVDPDNNHAPVIEAQTQITTQVGQPEASLAMVYDDGQPRDQTLASQWHVVSGDPSKVIFADDTDPETSITITKTGEYVLMLSASDGELSSAVNII